MLKKMTGFTFIEVMIALFLFTIITVTVLPAIVTTQNERLAIRDERFVEEYIHKAFRKMNYDGISLDAHTIDHNGVVYQVSIEPDGIIHGVCISWEGRNGRDYERCLSR